MCTAATYLTKDFYMGRTLDYEFSYGEEIAVMPRNYPIHFHYAGVMEQHYAMIGMHIWRTDIRFTMMQPMKKVLVWLV